MYVLTIEPYHDNSSVEKVSKDLDVLKRYAQTLSSKPLEWYDWYDGVEAKLPDGDEVRIVKVDELLEWP